MKFNSSSYFPLSNFCKSEESRKKISYNWMLGITKYAHTADSVTGKDIGKNRPFLWLADDKGHGKAIALETYLTAQRNKKRCAKYIEKFNEWGLPMDLDFGENCKMK